MVRMVKYKTRLTENKRIELDKEVSANRPGLTHYIKSPEDVMDVARDFLHLEGESEEYLYMIGLNTKNKVLGVFEVSHGTVSSSIFGTREIFQKALLLNAVSIILMHNHPSGDSTPSREDVDVTKKAAEAGKILGVEVLDHLIIGDKQYSSLKEKGYL